MTVTSAGLVANSDHCDVITIRSSCNEKVLLIQGILEVCYIYMFNTCREFYQFFELVKKKSRISLAFMYDETPNNTALIPVNILISKS
jgi:hypothetical protein